MSEFIAIGNPFPADLDQQEAFEKFVEEYLLKKFHKRQRLAGIRETLLAYARKVVQDEIDEAYGILAKNKVSEEEVRLYFRHEGPASKKKEFRLPRMDKKDFNLLRRVFRHQVEPEPVRISCRSRSFETEIEARSYCYDHDEFEWSCGNGVTCTLRDMQRFFGICSQLRVEDLSGLTSPCDTPDIYMEFWVLVPRDQL